MPELLPVRHCACGEPIWSTSGRRVCPPCMLATTEVFEDPTPFVPVVPSSPAVAMARGVFSPAMVEMFLGGIATDA